MWPSDAILELKLHENQFPRCRIVQFQCMYINISGFHPDRDTDLLQGGWRMFDFPSPIVNVFWAEVLELVQLLLRNQLCFIDIVNFKMGYTP